MVHLTIADIIVLKNLDRDIGNYTEKSADQTTPSDTEDEIDRQLQRDTTANQVTLEDEKTVQLLDDLTKKPTIFTAWDEYQLPKLFRQYIIHPYIDWANTIVRRPADIVFLTHILFYTATLIPSTVLLFRHFTYLHGILHLIFEVWCAGAWTLLLHNHIHNNGVLQKHLAWVDKTFPYVLGPLMGHTWNSYYWHHVKHHHVENNGPGDLSSTIRYQRDSVWHFIQYELRFLTLTWLELPLYFYRKGQYKYAARCATAEWSSLILLWTALWWNARPALFTLVLPLCIMRFGMMVGNWGQHCLVDEVDPDSDFRSSITLIDEASNRHCFNDGYHTSHHLNARRHWSEHPSHFIKSKAKYSSEGALTFKDIDYIFLTVRILAKNYDALAKCLVPMGSQIGMTHEEKMALIRTKTRAFSEKEILRIYGRTGITGSEKKIS